MTVADQPGVLATVATILARCNVSIDALRQRQANEAGVPESAQTDLVLLTHDCTEAQMRSALVEIQALPTVLDKVVMIRKEELV